MQVGLVQETGGGREMERGGERDGKSQRGRRRETEKERNKREGGRKMGERGIEL